MAANYLADADINAAIGSELRVALFSDSGGTESTTERTRAIEIASAIVKAAVTKAGYSIGDTTTDDTVIAATLGQFLAIAYGRKGEKVPEQFYSVVNLAEEIKTGKVPLPSLALDTSAAVGGVDFSDTSSSSASSRHQVFALRTKLDVY